MRHGEGRTASRAGVEVEESAAVEPGAAPTRSRLVSGRDLGQELWELGPAGVAYRARWELGLRTGLVARTERPPLPLLLDDDALQALVRHLPFADPAAVATALGGLIGPEAGSALAFRAREAARGRIRCFGRWVGDYGQPVDWHLNPLTGQRWSPDAHWTEILKDTGRVGDVKLTWEVGRFPHAFEMARATAFGLVPAAETASPLALQVSSFLARSPYGRGVHWASGQEIVIRLTAWLFAVSCLRGDPAMTAALPGIARHLYEGAVHLERHIDYARKAVYNNHLVSEAFGLYLAGVLLPGAPQARRWEDLGLEILDEQADRQVYEDGGYLMYSHNYERAALQMFLLAASVRRKEKKDVPRAWLSAMERALDFLAAQQYPDGRLPNYGSNDGALPAILSTCDYSDFRPFLQVLSLTARGERAYEPGPWDEEAAWLLGPAALETPVRKPRRASVSFAQTGFHVLAGTDPGTLASLRCGTLRDRFTQIDMLHLDVLWRGENVIVDGGTYLYNGPPEWNQFFTGGASHNTVTLDGHDQMVHHRRFKLIYLTKARLLRFQDSAAWVLAEGEHYGFRRYPGRCVHRRAVLHVRDDLWIAVDRIQGVGSHTARLHWLAGPYAHRYDADHARLTLETRVGDFSITVLDANGRPAAGDVVAGREAPPRGWLSRYYGEKVAVPSLAVERSGEAPFELVSVLAGAVPRVEVDKGQWSIECNETSVSFRVVDGRFHEIAVDRATSAEGVS